MDERMEKLLESPAADWDSLGEEDKALFLDIGLAPLALLSTEYLNTEKVIRRIENMEKKIREMECTFGHVNKHSPSEERDACMAVSPEKWKEMIRFYVSMKSMESDAISFLCQMAHKSEEGWPITPTLLQSRWALSLIDSFDNWPQGQIKAEQLSLTQKIAAKWKKSKKRVVLKRKTEGVG